MCERVWGEVDGWATRRKKHWCKTKQSYTALLSRHANIPGTRRPRRPLRTNQSKVPCFSRNSPLACPKFRACHEIEPRSPAPATQCAINNVFYLCIPFTGANLLTGKLVCRWISPLQEPVWSKAWANPSFCSVIFCCVEGMFFEQHQPTLGGCLFFVGATPMSCLFSRLFSRLLEVFSLRRPSPRGLAAGGHPRGGVCGCQPPLLGRSLESFSWPLIEALRCGVCYSRPCCLGPMCCRVYPTRKSLSLC